MGLGFSFNGTKNDSVDLTIINNEIENLCNEFGFGFKADAEGYVISFDNDPLMEINIRDNNVTGECSNGFAGPGFHKAAVEFIEKLFAKADIELYMDDETEYYNHRDFSLLQNEFLSWLEGLFKVVFENEENLIYLSYQIGNWRPYIEDNKIVTPLGIYDRSYFQEVYEQDKLNEFAKNYFIWFNEEKDEHYHKNIALKAVFNNYCWKEPRDDEELEIERKIIESFKKARELNKDLVLPVKNDDFDNISESLLEIGYRYGDIIMYYPGNWVARLPGNLKHDYYEKDKDFVCWDYDRSIRLTGFTFTEGVEAKDYRKILYNPENMIKKESDNYLYLAEVKLNHEEGYYILQGEITVKHRLAIVTITFTHENLKDWAVETFLNIKNTQA